MKVKYVQIRVQLPVATLLPLPLFATAGTRAGARQEYWGWQRAFGATQFKSQSSLQKSFHRWSPSFHCRLVHKIANSPLGLLSFTRFERPHGGGGRIE